MNKLRNLRYQAAQASLGLGLKEEQKFPVLTSWNWDPEEVPRTYVYSDEVGKEGFDLRKDSVKLVWSRLSPSCLTVGEEYRLRSALSLAEFHCELDQYGEQVLRDSEGAAIGVTGWGVFRTIDDAGEPEPADDYQLERYDDPFDDDEQHEHPEDGDPPGTVTTLTYKGEEAVLGTPGAEALAGKVLDDAFAHAGRQKGRRL